MPLIHIIRTIYLDTFTQWAPRLCSQKEFFCEILKLSYQFVA